MKSKQSANESSTPKVSAFKIRKPKAAALSTKSEDKSKGTPDVQATSGEGKHAAQDVQFLLDHNAHSSEAELQAQIAKRAHELYEQRGGQHKNDLGDWLQAAREYLAHKDPGRGS